MNQALTVEINEQVYQTICRQAEAVGKSPAEFAGALLEERCNGKHKAADLRTEAEKQASRERFERHFGAVSLNHPSGADNEKIDADLAREYGDTHEAN